MQMAGNNIAAPPTYLAEPGKPKCTWLQWRRMFENYMIACDLASAEPVRKRAVLLHALGAEGQRIFYSLPAASNTSTTITTSSTDDNEQSNEYMVALQILEAHFSPTVNVVAERFKFRQRAQWPGENIDDYIASIRELASTCNFQGFHDEMLRDQLVEKTNSARLRERLLLEPNLQLNKAIQIAQHTEQAIRDAKSLSNPKFQSTTSRPGVAESAACAKVHSRRNTNSAKRNPRQAGSRFKEGAGGGNRPNGGTQSNNCYRCGSFQHLANEPGCPARDAECDKCTKVGHYARMCRSKQINKPNSRRVHQIEDEHQSDFTVKKDEELHTHVLLTETTNQIIQNITCTVKINGIELPFTVDTASDVTLLNVETFDKYFVRDVLTQSNREITSYSKDIIPIIGCLQASVAYKGRKMVGNVYVVHHGASLLGKDAIYGLKLQIDGGKLVCMATEIKDGPTLPIINDSTANPSSSTQKDDYTSNPIAQEFNSLFTEGLGLIKGFSHRVVVKSGVCPTQQTLRRLPYAVRDKVSAELKRLENEGIIERVTEATEWVSPMVVVKKKSGDIRICVDMRRVNEAIVIEKHPIPHINELLSSMNGANIFSKLDLKSAYHQLDLHESSRDLTCFVSHEGLFRYTKVCFGLASAPTCFQKTMSIILRDLKNVECFIDDIIVFGRTQLEHNTALRDVLTRLQKAGMKLNDKCVFSVPTIEVLGHVIDREGMHPSPDLIKAIKDAPQPENKDQVRSFLGLAGYYAKFIKGFATLVQPIRDTMNQNSFVWSHSADKAFHSLKQAISGKSVLVLFNPTLDVVLTTDSSGYGVGGVLSHIIDGVEMPICFASRKLTQCEQRYSTGEREALACVWAVEKFHTYLWGRRFKLRTDHRALTTLLSTSGTGHRPMRIARWGARLLHYNYDIEYKPGADNKVADALSRLPLDIDQAAYDIEVDIETEISAVCQLVLDDTGITRNELVQAIEQDESIQKVAEYVRTGWPVNRKQVDPLASPFHMVHNELTYHDGILFRGDRVVVPSKLTSKVITIAHESHQGIVRTKQRLRKLYWWPKMDSQVQEMISKCQTCQSSDKGGCTRVGPLNPVPYPNNAWDKLGLDIVGPDMSAPPQNRFMISLVDYHSKWPEVAFSATVTTNVVIDFLLSVFSREGYPREIVTDHGPQFISQEFKQFLLSRNIRHQMSAIYHPQSNGEVERFNRVLKGAVQIARLEGKDARKSVREFLCVYRCTPHSTTGEEPSVLLHGRHMLTKLDIPKVTPIPETKPPNEVKAKVKLAQEKTKAYHDVRKASKQRYFAIGAWVKVKRPGHTRKGSSRFLGPFQIQRQVGPNTYKMVDGNTWNVERLVSFVGTPSPCQIPEEEPPLVDTGQVESQFRPRIANTRPPDFLEFTGQRVRPQRERREPAWRKDYVFYK